MKVNLIVAGGRDFYNYDLAEQEINEFLVCIRAKLREDLSITIISGACSDSEKGVLTFTRKDGTKVYGADGLGELYADKHGLHVAYFPAQWIKFGKNAGPIRNSHMATVATHGILFWDGESKGTNDIKEKLEALSKPKRVVEVSIT